MLACLLARSLRFNKFDTHRQHIFCWFWMFEYTYSRARVYVSAYAHCTAPNNKQFSMSLLIMNERQFNKNLPKNANFRNEWFTWISSLYDALLWSACNMEIWEEFSYFIPCAIINFAIGTEIGIYSNFAFQMETNTHTHTHPLVIIDFIIIYVYRCKSSQWNSNQFGLDRFWHFVVIWFAGIAYTHANHSIAKGSCVYTKQQIESCE